MQRGQFGYQRHCYVNGDVLYIIKIDRAANLVSAYNYTEKRSVQMLYSDFKRHAEKALSLEDASRLLSIGPDVLRRHMKSGFIPTPQSFWVYGKDPDACRIRLAWSESDLMEAQEALSGLHVGKPRKDGKITPRSTLPSKLEIRSAMTDKSMLYVKGKDGKFVPVFD